MYKERELGIDRRGRFTQFSLEGKYWLYSFVLYNIPLFTLYIVIYTS